MGILSQYLHWRLNEALNWIKLSSHTKEAISISDPCTASEIINLKVTSLKCSQQSRILIYVRSTKVPSICHPWKGPTSCVIWLIESSRGSWFFGFAFFTHLTDTVLKLQRRHWCYKLLSWCQSITGEPKSRSLLSVHLLQGQLNLESMERRRNSSSLLL